MFRITHMSIIAGMFGLAGLVFGAPYSHGRSTQPSNVNPRNTSSDLQHPQSGHRNYSMPRAREESKKGNAALGVTTRPAGSVAETRSKNLSIRELRALVATRPSQ